MKHLLKNQLIMNAIHDYLKVTKLPHGLIACLSLVALTTSVKADGPIPVEIQSVASGDYATAANWDLGVVPVTVDATHNVTILAAHDMTAGTTIEVASTNGVVGSLTVNGSLTLSAGELDLGFNTADSTPRSVDSTLAIGATGHVTFPSSWVYDGYGDVPAGISNVVKISLVSGAQLTSDTSGGGFGMRLWSEWGPDTTGDGKTWTNNGTDEQDTESASFEGVLRQLYADGVLTNNGGQTGNFDYDFNFTPGLTGADGTLEARAALTVGIDDLSTAFGGDNLILRAELAAGQTISGTTNAPDGATVSVDIGGIAADATVTGGTWSLTVDDGLSGISGAVDISSLSEGTVTVTASIATASDGDSFQLDHLASFGEIEVTADTTTISFFGSVIGIEATQTVSYTLTDSDDVVIDSGTLPLEEGDFFSGSVARPAAYGFFTLAVSATDTSGQNASASETLVLFYGMGVYIDFTRVDPLCDTLPFSLQGTTSLAPLEVVVTLEDSDGNLLRAVVDSADGPGAPTGGGIWSAPHTAFVPSAKVTEVESDGADDRNPEMAVLSDGSFVVVWNSYASASSQTIQQRRYNSDGTPAGAEVQLRAASADIRPAIAALSDGGWVVCLDSGSTIEQIRYASDGTSAGGFQTVFSGISSGPAITGLTGGGWVVAYRKDSLPKEIEFQVYDAAGSAVGSAVSFPLYANGDISIDALPTGGFVIACETFDESGQYIHCRTYDASGAPVSVPIEANAGGIDINDYQTEVATLSDGGWIVTWKGDVSNAIEYQRFSSTGAKVGGIQVVSSTSYGDYLPSVVGLPSGGWMLFWKTEQADLDGSDYVYQIFDSSGVTKLAQPALFASETHPFGWDDYAPRPALLADGSVALPFVNPFTTVSNGGEVRIGSMGWSYGDNPLSLLTEGTIIIRTKVTDSSGGTATGANVTTTLDNSLATQYADWAVAMGLTPGVNDGLDDVAVPGGKPNILHFAFDTDPFGDGSDEGKTRTSFGVLSGTNGFILTLPVRRNAVFLGAPALQAVVGNVRYTIRGTEDLTSWTQTVGQKLPPSSMGMPALRDLDSDGTPDWEYRSFYIATDGLPKGFLQGVVEEAP